jgi:hypothetical protein
VAATDLHIDVVREFHVGPLTRAELEERLPGWLGQESRLGGKLEGIVIKNFCRFNLDGNPIIAKYVRPEFKETHAHICKLEKGSPIVDIGLRYSGPARWAKAVQHLRDDGRLQNGPEDIGPLLREVQVDVETECAEDIKEHLYLKFRKEVLSGATRGLPEWYKEQLTKI